jgi:hypothetical protein
MHFVFHNDIFLLDQYVSARRGNTVHRLTPLFSKFRFNSTDLFEVSLMISPFKVFPTKCRNFSCPLYAILSKIKVQKINFPLILCGCETWPCTRREVHTLRVFERLGPKREEVTGGWTGFLNEELTNLYRFTMIT